MVKHEKPASFYPTFERKGKGQRTTHYCPGCGHGTVHKLIAEAIDEFAIQDRTVFLSPVGCSVFGYYYFDTGNIQCAHGRAPAVGTGVRRVRPESIIISYQGDGDLAGIGTAEIIHAANRGENMTVFFVNNAIYGMTGGQMAPTTLLGQRTMTTPFGRSISRDGGPIGMAEIIATLDAPVLVERVSLADAKRIMAARKAVRRALRNQIEGKGFSFVEILSPCPINWKMSPADARRWIVETLEPAFPIGRLREHDGEAAATEGGAGKAAAATADGAAVAGNAWAPSPGDETGPDGAAAAATPGGEFPFMNDDALFELLSSRHDLQDREPDTEASEQRAKIAGFGGQGVLSAGVLLANCAITAGMHATWLPSYGPEMRGGTANASVIVSPDDIGSPLVDYPTTLIAMNGPSLDAFEDTVEPGGLIIANSSIVKRAPARTDLRFFAVPATEMAGDIGFAGAANVILLTVYAALEGFPTLDVLRAVIPHSLRKKDLVGLNLKMVDAALSYVAEHGGRAAQGVPSTRTSATTVGAPSASPEYGAR